MLRILLAPNKELAMSVTADITIEAEYGDFVAEGTKYTAAHHQPSGPYVGRHVKGHELTGRPAPCNDPNIPVLTEGCILISHIDLDTLGGVFRAMGKPLFNTPNLMAFWNLVEKIDVNGPHRLAQFNPSQQEVECIQACWAWLQDNRPKISFTEVNDVTDFILRAYATLMQILLYNNEWLLREGKTWALEQDELNKTSLVRVETTSAHTRDFSIAVRESDRFVNHLYNLLDGRVCDCVVSYNTKQTALTVSFERDFEGLNARDIVQKLWGPDAGGHRNIAGSPRGRVMTAEERDDCLNYLNELLLSLSL
jgi:hypothetical protein